ncbi:MAG: galactokinase [Acidimicrobiales bacterium]
MRVTRCPGRVNLIGDHTDYNDGVALPMAIDLYTEVAYIPDPSSKSMELSSDAEPEIARVDIDIPLDHGALAEVVPAWSRAAAAVIAMMRPQSGGTLSYTGSLPVGAGLSSSAAFEVGTALALGIEGEHRAVAKSCRYAGEVATGVPAGIMDQLTVLAARQGFAMMIDFSDLSYEYVKLPGSVEVVVVHSGQQRVLAGSAYAARRAECEAASLHLGRLGQVPVDAASALPDVTLRKRARHVASECDRVRRFATALEGGDLETAGNLMVESHRSLASDFEVSTPALDDLVDRLIALKGVYGARLTGAGFGGCVVAICEPGSVDTSAYPEGAWVVRPSGGAYAISV